MVFSGFGPLLAMGLLSPPPPASRWCDVVVGLELPIAPRPWGPHGGAEPWGCLWGGTWHHSGGCPRSHLETSQRKPAVWKHLGLRVSTKHGGTHMETTQCCPRLASGDLTATQQSWWWHIPPCLSSEQSPQCSPYSDWAPWLRLQHRGLSIPPQHQPQRSLQTSPQKKPNLELGALGHPQPKAMVLALPGWREAEQEQEAAGCPTEGLLHCSDAHAAAHAPGKHSGSGHLTCSGSAVTSTQRSAVPDVNPSEGRRQQCCRLVTRPPGKVPGVTVALSLEGMAGGGDGTCSRRERC